MFKLVIIRHGETTWNRDGIFTGWVNVGLSERGVEEAREAGRILKESGFNFDLAFTSVLKRARGTLEIVLAEMGLQSIEVKSSWRLNERHYGALQGVNKKELVREKGEKQVFIWRRSYSVRPPALKKGDRYCLDNDPLYQGLKKKDLPLAESLRDTWQRISPFWREEIAPSVKAGRKVLISAHGSTSRVLVKHLSGLSSKEVEMLNVPTGIPLVFELKSNLKAERRYYLGDEARVEKAIRKVAEETKI